MNQFSVNISKKYSENIFAFVDVLGITDAIKKSQQDDSIFQTIYEVLKELKQIADIRNRLFKGSKKLPIIKIRVFSDTILVFCNTITEESFRWVLWVVSEIHIKMLLKFHKFVRGAITTGLIFDEDDVIFGPAYIRAYELQQFVAIWPRCIVDPLTLKNTLISPDESWEKRYFYLLKGDDGLPYLDYLGYSFNVFLTSFVVGDIPQDKKYNPESSELLMIKIMEWHKQAIMNEVFRLKREKDPIFLLGRYYQVAGYHNKVITSFVNSEPELANNLFEKMLTEIKKYGLESSIDKDKILHLKQTISNVLLQSKAKWEENFINLSELFGEILS